MQTKAEKILVIDDEEFVRDTVTGYLEDSGFEVLEAENGSDGIAVFDAEQPALVLCDLRMPHKDGIDVLKHIMSKNSDTPFIVLSGAGVMADVVEALKQGASDYLFKPLSDMAVLEHSIKKNLERARLRIELDNYRTQLEQTNNVLQNELDAGRKIQQKMLPQNSLNIGNWRFEYLLNPSHFLSGDFVEYFPITESDVFFYIVDVSGHGVSSAIVTMIIKNFIDLAKREMEIRRDRSLFDLSTLLKRLNLHLINLGFGRHATMFAGILNSKDESISYCSAAHFPTPIVISLEHCEAFPTDGMAVGLFEDAQYITRYRSLSEVEGFFFCSDGILEIIDAASLVEKESKLLQLVKESGNSITTFSDIINLSQVDVVPDDITILSLNRNG